VIWPLLEDHFLSVANHQNSNVRRQGIEAIQKILVSAFDRAHTFPVSFPLEDLTADPNISAPEVSPSLEGVDGQMLSPFTANSPGSISQSPVQAPEPIVLNAPVINAAEDKASPVMSTRSRIQPPEHSAGNNQIGNSNAVGVSSSPETPKKQNSNSTKTIGITISESTPIPPDQSVAPSTPTSTALATPSPVDIEDRDRLHVMLLQALFNLYRSTHYADTKANVFSTLHELLQRGGQALVTHGNAWQLVFAVLKEVSFALNFIFCLHFHCFFFPFFSFLSFLFLFHLA
jgi:hypothetical protein